MRPTHYIPPHGGRLVRLLAFRSVPSGVLVSAAIASYGGVVIASLAGWPLWAKVVGGIIPWAPVVAAEAAWMRRHHAWLALFYLLAFTQVGHVLEHVAQMVQIHGLELKGPAARGVIGVLDVEWVHFGWNTWVLLAALLLLIPYRRNAWLWATVAFALWHEAEHAYMIVQYLGTGKAGHPGLLAAGGVLGGGFRITRPDLHMLYNAVETIPLVVAFLLQLKRAPDRWVARALPRLPRALLLSVGQRSPVIRLPRGEHVLFEGEAADRAYVVVRGRLRMSCRAPDGGEEDMGVLRRGALFGENSLGGEPCVASIRTLRRVELVAIDRATMREVARHYESATDSMAAVLRPATA